MKYNDNGEYKDIYVKSFDTLPVGTEVDFDGSVVPSGWSEIADYSTSEIDTGKKWIDGKKIYRKVFTGSIQHNDTLISNVDTLINCYGTGLLASRYRLVGFFTLSSNNIYSFTFAKTTTNEVIADIFEGGSSATATSCNITIEYTKVS